MSQQSVTIEQLKLALMQPNAAIRKRALAVIFNEAKVEAAPLVEEYIGRKTDQALQSLALKVLEKLKAFHDSAQEVPLDRLFPLLQSNDQQARLLALRALADRKAPQLVEMVLNYCADDKSPEALVLLSKILRNNPHPKASASLIAISQCDSEDARANAIEGLVNIINHCLLPEILKKLLDPSPALKIRAYQLISKISRANLLDALEALLASTNTESSRLAAKLLPSFLHPDLIPLMERHIKHNDDETAALCRRALFLLAQKGHFEALQILEKFAKGTSIESQVAKTKPAHQTSNISTTPKSTLLTPNSIKKLNEALKQYPDFLKRPLCDIAHDDSPEKIMMCIKQWYEQLTLIVGGPLLTAYFIYGERSTALDRTTFRILQKNLSNLDISALLQSMSPAFPKARKGDLYPITLAANLRTHIGTKAVESMQSLQEIIKLTNQENKNAMKYISEAIEFIGDIIIAMDVIPTNKLVVKSNELDGMRIVDFLKSQPTPIDKRLLVNFDFAINTPVLISEDSLSAMNLQPFFIYNSTSRSIEAVFPKENEIWEQMLTLGTLDSFLSFIKDNSV